MAVTAASFKIRFPEFASVDDSRIQLFLDDAIATLNIKYWGEKYDLGTNYFTAHKLALAIKSESSGGSGGGSGGPVSARSVDGASVSYSAFTPADSKEGYYLKTSYGQEYWALTKSLPIPSFSV